MAWFSYLRFTVQITKVCFHVALVSLVSWVIQFTKVSFSVYSLQEVITNAVWFHIAQSPAETLVCDISGSYHVIYKTFASINADGSELQLTTLVCKRVNKNKCVFFLFFVCSFQEFKGKISLPSPRKMAGGAHPQLSNLTLGLPADFIPAFL